QEILPEKHPHIAGSLNNLAALYQSQGRYAEAEPLLRQALAINQEILPEKHPLVANSLNNLAYLYESQGRYAEAEPLFRQALAMFQEILPEKHPDIAGSLENLAFLYQAKGDKTSAIKYLTQSTDIQETNLDTNLTVGSERQKQEYMATISGTIDRSISLHTQAAPNNPEAIRLALTTILRRKGRILDAVTDNLKLIRQNITPENQQLLDELANTRTQLAALIFNKPANLTTEEYQNQVANLKGKADRQEAELASRSNEFRIASQPVTIEAIQKLIPTDTALVEIISYYPFNPKAKSGEEWGKPHYAAYILHSTGEPKWVDLGEAESINQTVKEFRTSLQRQDLLIKKIARSLDEKVMKPIRPLLGNTKTILLSPDSQLNLIPFAALIDENNQYLVENYSINYLTTGRDLIRLQNRGESKDNPLLMADVDFNKSGASLANNSPSQISNSPTQPTQIANRRSSEIDGLQFNPLPGTKIEAEAIATLLKNVTLLTGTQATENALKQIKSPQILHIATHGFFLTDLELVASANLNEDRGLGVVPRFDNPKNLSPNQTENPLLRSGIVLAGSNKRQSGDEDGVLTALETTYLRLYGTKLVVLSACETGVGDAENGEGVYGLRRALVIAGAESQLMSLWSVSDEGTKDLMVKYYTRLLKNEGRSEALRQVQLEMLKDKKYQHPYFWSAFIPSGAWSGMGN
ncbi:CHAT domain-containing tetratricopeptide repeat protein, partial [Limnofasciculus baicalensis]